MMLFSPRISPFPPRVLHFARVVSKARLAGDRMHASLICLSHAPVGDLMMMHLTHMATCSLRRSLQVSTRCISLMRFVRLISRLGLLLVLSFTSLAAGCDSGSEDNTQARSAGKSAAAGRKEAQKEQFKAKHKGRGNTIAAPAPKAEQ